MPNSIHKNQFTSISKRSFFYRTSVWL